jgi:general secretion pathway protein F
MRFEARTLNGQQQVASLIVDAIDAADARAQIFAKQLTLLSLHPVQSWRLGLSAKHRQQKFDLLLFAQELHALIAAGLSVIESLEALVERETHSESRSVLHRLIQSLKEGHRLSEAMARQSTVFPALFVGVMQAAEGTSDLPRALERYISYETRILALRHKIVSAAIYPSILMTVGTGVALFLLAYVVPRFASVYQGNARTLPWASQMLLNWGQFASQHALALLVIFTIVVSTLIYVINKRLRSGNWWTLLAWLPGAKPRLQVLELSRMYLTLGMLLEGGIALPKGMQLCEAVLSPHLKPKLRAAHDAVCQGGTLSSSLEAHQLSTPVALRLQRVGEQSGQLGIMLSRTAAFYDNETSRWIERFTKAFEPVLMAMIGIVIGLIVILLYMPIFDLAGSLQ